ncbi:MAG: YbaB/EbfC family nucleoid-associated protein [Mycoplasmatales bacterium]|nr:YbaB/EbfC family nucleoid-associated protein [Mycoplasmatales bacterium]
MNVNAMMAQAKKMQAEMEEAKAKLAVKEFKVEKQGVTVVVLGNKKIKSIDANEVLLDPEDKDILEDLIVIAINEAMDEIEAESAAMTPSMPGGMPF